MNVRMPGDIDDEFLMIQDEYLTQVNDEKGIVELCDIPEIQKDTYVWRGDITRLSDLSPQIVAFQSFAERMIRDRQRNLQDR